MIGHPSLHCCTFAPGPRVGALSLCSRAECAEGQAVMPSAWIRTRRTKTGKPRYRVEYRLGGRESGRATRARSRRSGAATLRSGGSRASSPPSGVPDLAARHRAASRRRRSPRRRSAGRRRRVDVAEATTVQHRTALNRALPMLGTRRVDEITPAGRSPTSSRRSHATGRRASRSARR